MKSLILILLTLLFVSCNPQAVTEAIRIFNPQAAQTIEQYSGVTVDIISIPVEATKLVDDEEPSRSRRGKRQCNDNDDYEDGAKVTLTQLPHVGSRNAGKYKLYGTCSDNREPVNIEVNGYAISHTPLCDRRRWEVFLNLTSLSTDTSEIVFTVSHSSESNIICETVKVGFSCPQNYIPVSPVKESRHYSNDAFCVMKYEASAEQGKAISEPQKRPVTNIIHSEALSLCRSNGPRYDLISNDQWQVLVQNIEFEDKNWSKGSKRLIDGNALNCGMTVGSVKSASNDDENSCAESECNDGWDYKKRIHFLPNNYVIWDLCGNAGEMMKNIHEKKSRRNYNKYSGYVYAVTPSDVKKDFGPRRNYETSMISARRNHYWGLGSIRTNREGSLIIRGEQGRDAGIFSANVNEKYEEYNSRKVGFRCVYNP